MFLWPKYAWQSPRIVAFVRQGGYLIPCRTERSSVAPGWFRRRAAPLGARSAGRCRYRGETETGLLVTVRGSKTDQERAGATIAIARGDVACPAKALREWLDAAGIEDGPIFRPIDRGGTVRPSRLTDRSVANIVKAYAERAGFDASAFSGHSLRAGFLTSAAGKGASIFKMMDVSRHKSVDTLRGYVRDAELFKDHAGAGLL